MESLLSILKIPHLRQNVKRAFHKFFGQTRNRVGRALIEWSNQRKGGPPLQKNELAARYEQAAAILPSRLRKAALALSDEEKAQAEELRLRAGRPLTVLLPTGELPLNVEVEPEELETLCDIATEFSRYAASETIREGFLPVRGGFRVGLCGTAVGAERRGRGHRPQAVPERRLCQYADPVPAGGREDDPPPGSDPLPLGRRAGPSAAEDFPH